MSEVGQTLARGWLDILLKLEACLSKIVAENVFFPMILQKNGVNEPFGFPTTSINNQYINVLEG